jgi:hypothetical protein
VEGIAPSTTVSTALGTRGRKRCTTNADSTVLTWGNGKFTKIVPLHPEKNVAIMSTKAGIKKYNTFVAKVKDLEPKVCCFVATGTPKPSVAEVTDDEPDADDEKSVNSSSTTARDEAEERKGVGHRPKQPFRISQT